MSDSVFRTVVRQQSKIVKGDIILITKAPEQPWAIEAMGRIVTIDKSKVPKGDTHIPAKMQTWLSYISLNGSQKEDFKLQADRFRADLEDDELDSDLDSDGEDSIDLDNSVPEGMDTEDSPELKHAIHLASHLSSPRATDFKLNDNRLSLPQSIDELASYKDSPLIKTTQQNTLEQILDAINLGVKNSPSTLLDAPKVLQLTHVELLGGKESADVILKEKQIYQENSPISRHTSIDLENNLGESSCGTHLKLTALSRRLFASDSQPSKLDTTSSPDHKDGCSSSTVTELPAPNHIAVFSPRKLRSRKPNMSDEGDPEDEVSAPNSDEESVNNIILGSISPMKLPAKNPSILSSDDRLIETRTLSQLGLSYNIKYNILICNECQSGISISGVPDHAYKGAIKKFKWDERRRVWVWMTGEKHNHPKIMKSRARAHSADTIQGWIIQELEDILKRPVSPLRFAEASLAIRMEWLTHARPHPDQIGPIAGLRVYKNAFKCTTGSCQSAEFPYFSLVQDSIRPHAKIQHPGIQMSCTEGYTVQTLTHYLAFTHYFEVTERNVHPSTSKSQQVNHADIIHQERQHLLGGLENSRGLDGDLIHEAFGDVGMKKFWALLDQNMIAPLFKPFNYRSKSREDELLRTAVIATFFDITRHVGDAHPALLHLITKGAFFDKLSGKRKFTLPNDDTLSYYVSTEIKFLHCMIYALNQAVMNQQGKCIFDFDRTQIDALNSLIKALQVGHLGEVSKRVVQTFHAFYFPTNLGRSAFNVFAEPLNAFLALLCLDENITPRNLNDSSHYCARVQFAIRLRGFHHLFLHATVWLKLPPSVDYPTVKKKSVVRAPTHQSELTGIVRGKRNPGRVARETHTARASDDYIPFASDTDPDEPPKPSKKLQRLKGVRLESHPDILTMELDPVVQQSNQESNWWCDFAIPFCSQYLTAYQLTPYAYVRETIRVISYALAKKRKTATTFWKDDSTVIIGSQMIDLSIFRSFLSSQIERLEEFFRTEILFGKKLDELGITVDFRTIEDDGNMTTLMHSPLLESIRGNHDSDILLNFMLEDKSVVEINPGDNKMRWHAGGAEKWLGNIHYGTSRLQAVAHITQGAPGRMSEEAKSQLTNTEVGRRHLVILQALNTLALWSNYSKTTKVTGAFKEVLRVYPHRIARLIFILIRLVRPIEVLYLLKHRHAQVSEELELVVTAYKSKLWASFGTPFTPHDMCENLADFLMSDDGENPPPFPFLFGVRLYREFAAAVQRRHIKMPAKYSRVVAQQGTQVGDLQAGRSTETSLQNYAVEKSVIDMEPGFTEHYISYSRTWQAFWGLDLEGMDNVQYLV